MRQSIPENQWTETREGPSVISFTPIMDGNYIGPSLENAVKDTHLVFSTLCLPPPSPRTYFPFLYLFSDIVMQVPFIKTLTLGSKWPSPESLFVPADSPLLPPWEACKALPILIHSALLGSASRAQWKSLVALGKPSQPK